MSNISFNTQAFQVSTPINQSRQNQASIRTIEQLKTNMALSPEQQNTLSNYKQDVIDDAILSIEQAREASRKISVTELAIESKKEAINAYTIAAHGESVYDTDDEESIERTDFLVDESPLFRVNNNNVIDQQTKTVQLYQQIANPVESNFLALSV